MSTDANSKTPDELPDEMPNTAPAEPLRLDHFLKSMGMSETGGQAKLRIQNSEVKVNGEIETRRRRKLVPNDVVQVDGQKFVVKAK